LKGRQKTNFKNDVANEVMSLIFETTSQAISPVTGSTFRPLSKDYKAAKKKLGKGTTANLRLKERMLPSMVTQNKANGVEFKITDSKEKLKANNHIKGDTLPRRPFLPDDSKGKTSKFGSFSTDIKSRIEQLFREAKDGNQGDEENNVRQENPQGS
jgi:hypothetical protein